MKREIYNDNEILIACLQKGDEKAYAFLIDTYHYKLCVYANSLTKNIDNAEDIVQNVFVKTWEQRSQLKADHAIKNFLYKLVYNEFIDHYRKKQSLFSLEKTYYNTLNTVVLEDDSESFNQILTVVKKEIHNLPEKCKEVFILSKQEGLTNIEIAEHLNISVKAVEARITKAFSILRSSLKDKFMSVLFMLFGSKNFEPIHNVTTTAYESKL
jgi:RNA polymerase sigma-70 factor (family 1)